MTKRKFYIYITIIYLVCPISVYANGDLYNFRDSKTSGFVELLKDWSNSLFDRDVIPEMRISVSKPSKSPLGFEVAFDANGGVFSDGSDRYSLYYSNSGKIVAGEYMKDPIFGKEAIIFDGWQTRADGGYKVSVVDGYVSGIEVQDGMVLYARWKNPVRYAVSIYGIEHDVDENGNSMGLTFGGATGNYLNSYKDHEPKGTDANGNYHRCIHRDSWDDIVDWNMYDPYVYEDCLTEGCTKPIILEVKGLIWDKSGSMESYGYTGDGPGLIRNEISTGLLSWSKKAFNDEGVGGYGTSIVRAILNGWDDLYDSSINPDKYGLSQNKCVLYSFPDVLKSAIGRKKVSYRKKYSGSDAYTEDDIGYVYDKLWLFSATEVTSQKSYNNVYEGSLYKKAVIGGGIKNLKNTIGMSEVSTLRSIYTNTNYNDIHRYVGLTEMGFPTISTISSPNFDSFNIGFSLSR